MSQATMDYQGVQKISNVFNNSAASMRVASTILEAAIMILHTEAFVSFGSTEWLAQYLSNIKPKLDTLAQRAKRWRVTCSSQFNSTSRRIRMQHRRFTIRN